MADEEEKRVLAVHRLRHLLVSYVGGLKDDELPDPDVVIEFTKPVKELFQFTYDAANKAMAGKQKNITQLNFEMLEETALAYMIIAVRYAQALKKKDKAHRSRK